MNHEENGLKPSESNAARSNQASTGRESYATPRLTAYGRMQRLTGTAPAASQGDADEAVFDFGEA